MPPSKSIKKFCQLKSSCGLLILLDSSIASRVMHCGHNPPEDHEAYVAQPLQNFNSLVDIILLPIQRYPQNLSALILQLVSLLCLPYENVFRQLKLAFYTHHVWLLYSFRTVSQ